MPAAAGPTPSAASTRKDEIGTLPLQGGGSVAAANPETPEKTMNKKPVALLSTPPPQQTQRNAAPVAALPAHAHLPAVTHQHRASDQSSDDATARDQWDHYLRLKKEEGEAAAVAVSSNSPQTGDRTESPRALQTPPFETVRESRQPRTAGDTELDAPPPMRLSSQAALLERMQQRGIQKPQSVTAAVTNHTEPNGRLWSEDMPRQPPREEESPFPTPSAVSLASQHRGLSNSLEPHEPPVARGASLSAGGRSESYRTAEASPAPSRPEREQPAVSSVVHDVPVRGEEGAAGGPASISDRCFFIVAGLAGHARVKLKLAPNTELSSLFGYFFAKVQAPAVVQQKSYFAWNGIVLDPSKTPLDYKMGTSMANVNTVRIMPKRDAVLTPSSAAAIVSGPRPTGGDSVELMTELQLQLHCAQAKAELLEFQLKRKANPSPSVQQHQAPSHAAPASAPASSTNVDGSSSAVVSEKPAATNEPKSATRPRHLSSSDPKIPQTESAVRAKGGAVQLPADVDEILDDDLTTPSPTPRDLSAALVAPHPTSRPHRQTHHDELGASVPVGPAVEKEMLEAAKRRSAREYAKEKKQEAAYWKHQFECAAKELALVKVLVAQQAAVLDRLGVPSFPFPDALVGSAFVHKSYNFDDAVSPCFASM